MSVQIVFQQMIVIVVLVCLGMGLYKKNYIDDAMSAKLSSIVVDVCNPLLCISCSLDTEIAASHRDIAIAVGIAAAVYLVLIIGGMLIPKLCRIGRGDRKFYHVMLVYANTGFIGIPVARAVLPPEAMVYIVIFNIMFSVFFYTHGVFVMKSKAENSGFKLSPGIVCSLLTILIFWLDISLPGIVADCVSYIGNATTFLSMTLLGCSFAAASAKTMFSEWKMYLFTLIKMLLVPLGFGCVMSLLGVDRLMLEAFVLMLAMPVANLPLMQAKKNHEDTEVLTRGILLTTLFMPVTLTVVSFVLTKI
ncbi:MAG: AEC family transporter [Lachnospiraceae bacterium]|nr:AEC family transporter [Lachnospiraceae bacterium]